MKNVIEILDRYYQSFINQKRDWDFFLGLADYVKYATETSETDKILKSIIQKRNDDEKELKKYAKEVIRETKEAKDKLFEIIKKHKISYESLNREMKEYQSYEDGSLQCSLSEAEAFSNYLEAIIRNLFKGGYKDLVKDFAVEHKDVPNEIGEYTFSKTMDLFLSEQEKFNNKEPVKIWGAWNNLALVYLVIFRADEELERLQKDEKNFYNAWNFYGLVGEMKKIRGGNTNELTDTVSDFKPIHFIKENYVSHASRIHNHLLKELNLQITKQEQRSQPPVELFTEKVVSKKTMAELLFKDSMDEWQRQQLKERQEEKRHRESMKQQRILGAKVDKYTHALDLIIERAECVGSGKDMDIDYYDFNFPDRMDDLQVLKHFLGKLQKDGCFKECGHEMYDDGSRLRFTKIDIGNLKKFKEKREEQETKTGSLNEEVLKTQHLLDELENDINEKARAMKKPAEYENGILKFRGKEINFRNKQNQKDLLATLFEDPKKNWYYDEIQGTWDDQWENVKETNPKAKDYWKKFYSAGNDINTAVAIETQVKDFIIKNTKEIRINPKYI